MSTATLTSKGQITLPKSIRNLFKLQPGHKLEFVITGAGEVCLKPRRLGLDDLYGMAATLKKASLEDMNQSIANYHRKKRAK